jgi:hypothetical protein
MQADLLYDSLSLYRYTDGIDGQLTSISSVL